MKKRILVVDDHALVRLGIRGLLNGNFTICGEGSNGQEAIDQTIALEPDLIILDVSMPVLNGIEAARQIRNIAPATKILLLSMYDSPEVENEGRAAGADGFLSKTSATEQLVRVIDQLTGDPRQE